VPAIARRQVVAAAIVSALLGLVACDGGSHAEADATERDTCAAVDRLGAVMDAFLTGEVRPGDPKSLKELGQRAHAVRRAAATSDNTVLARAGVRVSAAASALGPRPAGQPRRYEESPDALIAAFRVLDEECGSLDVVSLGG
jgi:hypothetical protein